VRHRSFESGGEVEHVLSSFYPPNSPQNLFEDARKQCEVNERRRNLSKIGGCG